MITLVTGGSRSGKSRYAESLFQHDENILYIATAMVTDNEMEARIDHHRKRRSPSWETFEFFRQSMPDRFLLKTKDGVLLDCITLLLSGLVFNDAEINADIPDESAWLELEEKIREKVETIIFSLAESSSKLVIVTNEIGSGVIGIDRITRRFVDLQGRVNQWIAAQADRVVLLVSGIAVQIKESK